MAENSRYNEVGTKARDEAAAKKANKAAEAAANQSFNISAGGLGAYAARKAAEKAAATPTPTSINTVNDLGGTNPKPRATPMVPKTESE